MDKSNSLVKDIINIMSSNFLILIASVVTGLLVPSILGATYYGYYRMFVLYTTYTALLHFGFVDGILLKDGGKDYSELDKFKYRSNSIVYILFQLFISIVFIIISLFIHNSIYSLLISTVGIGTFLINVNTYYQFISQITLKFNYLAINNSIQAILTVIGTFLFWMFCKFKIFAKANYSSYIFIVLFIYFVITLIYIVLYKDITFGKHDLLICGVKRIIKYCKLGIYLTIAYQVSNLITIIDNQLVSIFFKASVYGKYSFSYSITGTAMTLLGAVATALFPHLKRYTFKHIISIYPLMMSYMMLFVYFGLLAYFPFCILVKFILPGYIQSLSYLKIFLPELGITCCVTMIIFNYYNVFGKSKFYFYMSLLVLILSGIIDFIFYIVFNNPFWLAFGSLVSIFIWYILSEYFLVKWYKVKWIKNFIYMILMIGIFIISSSFNNLLVGFLLYLVLYVVISLFIYTKLIKKDLKNVLKSIF